MFQVRFHGRGGQGLVTTAEMLSVAAFNSGSHAQAFPTFGSERTGAPVTAFCRIDEHPIRTREPISEPDAVVIGDPTLLHQVDVFGGLKPGGWALLNSSRTLEELGIDEPSGGLDASRLFTVAATEIARRRIGRPLPGAALLGAFAALSGRITIDSLAVAIRERFAGEVAEGNVAAAVEAYESVLSEVGAVSDA